MSTLKNATIIDYASEAISKIFVFSLKRDSVVSPLNTENFLKAASLNPNPNIVKSYFLDTDNY